MSRMARAGSRPVFNWRPVPAPCISLMPLTASVRHKEPPVPEQSQRFPGTRSRYISSIMMMAMTDCIFPLSPPPPHVSPISPAMAGGPGTAGRGGVILGERQSVPDASLRDGIKHLGGRLAVKIIDAYRKSIKKCQGRLRAA